MEEWIFIGVAILLIFCLATSSKPKPELENEYDVTYRDTERNKEKEEMFYHPVTGYKGNRVNMDAYIINREKELTNGK